MRPIDADPLKKQFTGNPRWTTNPDYYVRERIDAMPTLDAVPVVRCRDCRWWQNVQCSAMISDLPLSTDPDWFCADGERRDDYGTAP